MPKCVKCDKFFHPDFCVEVPDSDPVVCKCVFCHIEKKEVTVEDEETGKPVKTLTKAEAEEEYRRYVHDLRHSDEIVAALAGKGTARPQPRN
jgi:hypothetical protein